MIEENKNMTAKMRVMQERDELLDKLIKLRRYLRKKDAKQRDLLEKQAKIMRNYIDVLNERLCVWEDEE